MFRSVKRFVPSFIKKWWKRAKIKRTVAQRKRRPKVKKHHIKEELEKIGLRKGMVILTHSSLSHLGPVEGGARTVVDALLEVLGSEGTLLMPAYPIRGTMLEYAQSGKIFDPRNSPSQMGAITECFRSYPGVIRSLHPIHSVCGLGPRAEYLLKDHEKSLTPCGKMSPFYKLVELDGFILHLSSRFGQTTSLHVIEDTVKDFPRKIYLDKTFPVKFLDWEGNANTTEIKVHHPLTAKTRIDRNVKKEKEIYQYCLEYGVVKTGKVGNAEAHLIKARGLEEVLEILLKKGITIYA